MSGFVELAKIVLKVAFFTAILVILGSVLLSLANLSPIVSFLNGLTDAFNSIINFTYNVLYYWTAGAFRYIYIGILSVLISKLTFWSVYGGIQGYKIVVEWLMK